MQMMATGSCRTESEDNLRYADDTVLIADSEDKLQDILTAVTEASTNDFN